MKQLGLNFEPNGLPRRFSSWKKFHYQNQHVLPAFIKSAVYLLGEGIRKPNSRTVWEWMRCHRLIATKGTDGYNLPNNHCPYYARLAMLVEPRLKGMFVTRNSQFDATDEMILEAHQNRPPVS